MPYIPGNHVGDDCDNDYDGDGTVDTLDICPSNSLINRTNFFDYMSVRMYPSSGEVDPEWLILYDGLEVRQARDTNVAALLLGEYQYIIIYIIYFQKSNLRLLFCENSYFELL